MSHFPLRRPLGRAPRAPTIAPTGAETRGPGARRARLSGSRPPPPSSLPTPPRSPGEPPSRVRIARRPAAAAAGAELRSARAARLIVPGGGAGLPAPAPSPRRAPPPGPSASAAAAGLPSRPRSPSGRPPAPGSSRRLPTPPAPLPCRGGAGAARRAPLLTQSDRRLGRRGGLRRHARPRRRLQPAPVLRGSPAQAPPGTARGTRGHSGPAGRRDAGMRTGCEWQRGYRGAWPRGSESLCAPLRRTLPRRRRPGYLRARLSPGAGRVGRSGASAPSSRPSGSLCSARSAGAPRRRPALAPGSFSEAPGVGVGAGVGHLPPGIP